MTRSPSVRLLERDLSTYTVTSSRTTLAVVGYASFGPIGEPRVLTSLGEFQNIFGEGASSAPWSYLSAYRAFNQTNKLIFMRVAQNDDSLPHFSYAAEKTIRTFDRGSDGIVEFSTTNPIPLQTAEKDKTFAIDVSGEYVFIQTPSSNSFYVESLVAQFNSGLAATNGFDVITDGPYTSTETVVVGYADSTGYDLDVTVDGILQDLTWTSSGTTVADLISDINGVLTGAIATLDTTLGKIKITSTGTAGSSSTILIEAGTEGTGTDVLAAIGATSADGTYAVDGRAAISDLEAQNNNGKFRIVKTGADPVVDVAAFTSDEVGGYENFLDYVGGVLDGVEATITNYSVSLDPEDGYCINFKAKYSGSYGSNVQIQKIETTNDFDGSTSHTINVLYKNEIVETYSDVSLYSAHENYFVNLINELPENDGSSFVEVSVTEKSTDGTNFTVDFPAGTYTLGASDSITEEEFSPGDTDYTAYDYLVGTDGVPTGGVLADDEEYERTIFLEALSTSSDSPMMNSELYDFHILVTPDTQQTAIQDAAITLAETDGRKDFIYIVDPPQGLTYSEVRDWHNGKTADRSAAINSSYAALYWSWQKDTNPTNGKIINVPPSVFVAEKYLQIDNNYNPWSAPAGDLRGRIISQGYEASPSYPQRNELYANMNAVNPIVDFVGKGLIIYGQKTLYRANSALNRVNTRRMLIYIKKLMKKALEGFIFEVNNADSYARARNAIEAILNPVRRGGGIERSAVIIDDTTTTPEIKAQNMMKGVVRIVPANTIEAIDISIVLLNPGASVE